MKNEFVVQTGLDIKAPLEKVWEALIKPELIRQYFFGTNVETDWKVGSSIIFTGEWQGKSYKDKGIVKENTPNKRLKYSYWSSLSGTEDIPENYVYITYELSPKNDGTYIQITQEKIPNEEMREHSEENWRKVLNDLKKMIEKEHIET